MRQMTQKEDWDFAKEDVHYMTHGLHPYPAMMIPQIAKRLIKKYSSQHDVVLDPFCGSGGVLVEAMLAHHNCFGIDINPLACLLAKVKTTPIDPSLLTSQWTELRNEISKGIVVSRFEKSEIEVPEFPDSNIHYWFKPSTIKELYIIKKNLDSIPDEEVRDFFYACFSKTVRQVSGTRKGEFKLYRIPEEKWVEYQPNTIMVFESFLNTNISKMGEFFNHCEKEGINAKAEIFEADTSKLLTEEFPDEGRKKLYEGSVDLIVTSPPYGDSRTTVAYGQFCRYSLIWLGYAKKRTLEIDKVSLGGQGNQQELNSRTLEQTLENIPNTKRASEVKSYFSDLYDCLSRLCLVLSSGGHACFVLGNRTVNRIKIPTDQILVELGREFGFSRLAIIYRKIPSKRIPWKSSPTNIRGKKVDTISKESIVVLEK